MFGKEPQVKMSETQGNAQNGNTETESIFIKIFANIKDFTIGPLITDARSLIVNICELFHSESENGFMYLISAIFANIFLYLFVLLAVIPIKSSRK